MKKTICFMGMGLLLVSMVLVSCAPMQKTIITKDNLSALKGTWSGWMVTASNLTALATLEIYNDTVPVKGKITLENIPQPIADYIPADEFPPGAKQAVIPFNNGKISDQGTLVGQSGMNFLRLTYYAGEKPKLDGWFFFYGLEGTLTVNKK